MTNAAMTDKQAPNFIERWTSVIMDNKLPSDKQAPESRGTEVGEVERWHREEESRYRYAAACGTARDRPEPVKRMLLDAAERHARFAALLATQRSTEPAVRGDAEALRDAARYRLIRARAEMRRPNWDQEATVEFEIELDHPLSGRPIGDELDEAIDAALAQTPEGKDET